MKAQLILFGVISELSAITMGSDSVRDKMLAEAWDKGAEGNVVFRVVDEIGTPVEGASCTGWMRLFVNKEGGYSYRGKTDTNGLVTVSGKCSESFSAIFSKEGYYKSRDEIFFNQAKTNPIIKNGKWQPYGEQKTVVLKRIMPRANISVFPRALRDKSIPKFDSWLGFDFEKADWVRPYGIGDESDVLIRFSARVSKRFVDFSYAMEVSFTNNAYAGAYVLRKDKFSDLCVMREADANALYKSQFSYHIISTRGKGCERMLLGKDEYLVYRTRTKVGDDGELLSAHYGAIHGDWLFDDKGMTLSDGCFNIIENNLRIDDFRELRQCVKR